MVGKPNWTPEQLQAINEREREVVVCAAAGSGKTAVLVQRVLQAALGNAEHPFVPLEKMLVVTFTKAAAAEMKARLEKELLDAREKLRSAMQSDTLTDGETQQKLKVLNRQLLALPMAQISTIDSFLTDVVRRYGYIEGIELGKVLGEDEAKLIRHRIATEMLDSALDGSDSEVTQLALAWGGRDGLGAEDLSNVRSDSGLRNLVLKLSEFCKSLADQQKWFAEYFDGRELDPQNFDLEHPLSQRLAVQLSNWIAETTQHDCETEAGLVSECPSAVCIEIIQQRRRILEQVNLSAGWGACATVLSRLKESPDELPGRLTPLSMSKKNVDDPVLENWLKKRQGLVNDTAKNWISLLNTPWAEVAASENASRSHIKVLWRLMQQFNELYSAHKTQRSVCDFSDLSSGAFRLLAAHSETGKPAYSADGHLVASAVALEYRRRFSLVVVDEFQDTNPLQEAIVDLVTRDAEVGTTGGRPVFVVGDIKQSIYGFRLAEPLLLSRRRQRLAADTEGGAAIQLAKNFRSRKLVLSAVNYIFLGLMDEALGGEDYSQNQLEAGADYDKLFEAVDAQPAPDVPATLHLVRRGIGENVAEDDELTKDQLQYKQVASVLNGVLAQGQNIYDKSANEVRAVAWRDMVVLLRSGASGRLEDLRAVLESAGIPTYAPARSGFFERPEISDAVSLLRLLDNPRDDIAFAAALTGPACGVAAEELLALSQTTVGEDNPASLWDKANAFVQADSTRPLAVQVGGLIEQYHCWRDAARHKPIAEMLWQLLQEAGLFIAYSPAANGGQRVENLLRLHTLACEVAAPNQHGLAWFLRYLEQSKRAKGDLGEAPVLGEGEDVVRVMTIHQSKGLEFPVVVVPNVNKGFNDTDIKVDLLWHRDLGLGGRHVDFYANPPKRTDTLSRRLVRDAKWRDIQAEELRVLYVALTRARERLELVGFADEKWPEKLAGAKPKAAAKTWLDWIAPKFASEIETAWDAAEATEPTADNPWRLNIICGVDDLPQQAKAVSGVHLEDSVLEKIRSRLLHEYSFTPLTKTGTKLSVTALAKHGGEDGRKVKYNVLDDSGEALVETEQPKFMAGESKISAAEIGSATHFVCAHIDYRNPPDVAALQAMCAGYVESGQLPPDMPAHLNISAIANAAAEISQRFVGEDSQIYPELPVGMQLSAENSAVVEYYESGMQSGSCAGSSEFVFVQGALDLLIITGNNALVIDFKTDRNADEDTLMERHAKQLELYCRCVGMMLPDAKVSYLIYGLDCAGMIGPVAATQQPDA